MALLIVRNRLLVPREPVASPEFHKSQNAELRSSVRIDTSVTGRKQLHKQRLSKSENEWNRIKEPSKKFYVKQGLSLEDVMKTLIITEGFHATYVGFLLSDGKAFHQVRLACN